MHDRARTASLLALCAGLTLLATGAARATDPAASGFTPSPTLLDRKMAEFEADWRGKTVQEREEECRQLPDHEARVQSLRDQLEVYRRLFEPKGLSGGPSDESAMERLDVMVMLLGRMLASLEGKCRAD